MIQDRSTGNFKGPGTRTGFSKIGKIWPLAQLKSHLRCFDSYTEGIMPFLRKRYHANGVKVDDCDVVEMELVVKSRKPMKDFLREDIGEQT